MPLEKSQIEDNARRNRIEIKILPRIGIGKNSRGNGPDEIIMYQLMGRDFNGNTCPFLDTESGLRTPNGGYRCKIYEERPLACRAYPVNQCTKSQNPILDTKCQFCATNTERMDKNSLIREITALKTIKQHVRLNRNSRVWRYATHIGEETDTLRFLPEGWYVQDI